MKKAIAVGSIILSVLLSGCVTTPATAGFYWGNYSKSLYKYKKNPNPTTLNNHIQTLESIVKRCESNQTFKIPPGIYAELGEFYLSRGDKDEALVLFKREATEFPESSVLMKTLITKAQS